MKHIGRMIWGAAALIALFTCGYAAAKEQWVWATIEAIISVQALIWSHERVSPVNINDAEDQLLAHFDMPVRYDAMGLTRTIRTLFERGVE